MGFFFSNAQEVHCPGMQQHGGTRQSLFLKLQDAGSWMLDKIFRHQRMASRQLT